MGGVQSQQTGPKHSVVSMHHARKEERQRVVSKQSNVAERAPTTNVSSIEIVEQKPTVSKSVPRPSPPSEETSSRPVARPVPRPVARTEQRPGKSVPAPSRRAVTTKPAV